MEQLKAMHQATGCSKEIRDSRKSEYSGEFTIVELNKSENSCIIRVNVTGIPSAEIDSMVFRLARSALTSAANTKTLCEEGYAFSYQSWSILFFEPNKCIEGEIYADAKCIGGYDDAPVFSINVFSADKKQIAMITVNAFAK